jgi:hypothetical protein
MTKQLTEKQKKAYDHMRDALQTLTMELTGGYNHDPVAADPYDQRHLQEAVDDAFGAVDTARKAKSWKGQQHLI